ncbi:MAG: hypoxanthine phosphoribosyltransferase [Flavobacteriales bacterium]
MSAVVQIHELSFAPFIDQAQIQTRIDALAKEIDAQFTDKDPLFLAVLNGAFLFAADLIRQVNCKPEISFVKVSSYQGTQSSGRVDELIGLQTSLKGRHVIVLEDILDTGVTMDKIFTLLESEQPASISICALLLKPDAYKGKHQPTFIGFEIPDAFVVGYGLDYKELGRELKSIYQLIN